ncbi:hypothetical protein TIFTF001_026482 [Ficus carica]|uniref:Uncharacterized protein n=1 Tax=Ficus carica TaxID=3494 RepID=A0AA88DLA7_FICCA|nr:hypothetical protein TIFTF001_026482 [Ficus carica]
MRTRRRGRLWVEKQVRPQTSKNLGDGRGWERSKSPTAMGGRVAIRIGIRSGIKTHCRI